MKTILSIFRTKIGFTIFVLFVGIFVAMGFTGIRPNRIYVLLASHADLSIDHNELSTYSLVFYNVEPHLLQVPPGADGLPMLIPTNDFLIRFTNLSPRQFNVLLSYQNEYNESHAIDIFEVYSPSYDPIEHTVTWTAKIFDETSIPHLTLNQVSAFISLK